MWNVKTVKVKAFTSLKKKIKSSNRFWAEDVHKNSLTVICTNGCQFYNSINLVYFWTCTSIIRNTSEQATQAIRNTHFKKLFASSAMAGTLLIKEYLLKQNNQTKQKHTHEKHPQEFREYTSKIINKSAEYIRINL